MHISWDGSHQNGLRKEIDHKGIRSELSVTTNLSKHYCEIAYSMTVTNEVPAAGSNQV